MNWNVIKRDNNYKEVKETCMSLPNSSKGPVDKHTSSERGNFEKHSKTKIQIFMGEKKFNLSGF